MSEHWRRAVVEALIGARELDRAAIDVLLASLADEETLQRLAGLDPKEAARELSAPLVATPRERHMPMPEHPLEPVFLVAFFQQAR